MLRLGDQGGTVPFTYADLVGTTLGAMYSPDAWPDLAAFLQELDTLTSPARAAKALRGLRQHLRLSRVPYEQVLEGFAGGWCLDPVNPRLPLGLGPGRPPGRPPRPLLRPPVELVGQHLCVLAGP